MTNKVLGIVLFTLFLIILFEIGFYYYKFYGIKASPVCISEDQYKQNYKSVGYEREINDEALKKIYTNTIKLRDAKVFQQGKIALKFNGIIKKLELAPKDLLIIYLVKSKSQEEYSDDQYFTLDLNMTKITYNGTPITYKNLKKDDLIELEVAFDYNKNIPYSIINQQNIIVKKII